MAEQKRIPCPGCATRKRLSIDNERWRPCEMCGSVRDGTIPDRRAPSAAEDDLRAKVARLQAELRETAAKRDDEISRNLAYEAELAKFTGPLTDEQARSLVGNPTAIGAASFMSSVGWHAADAAIRAAREGER